MSHRSSRVIILAVALLIIGMRGLCAAQFSQRPASKSTALCVAGTLPFGQNVRQTVAGRIGGGLNGRIKKFVYPSPAYRHIATQRGARRQTRKEMFLTQRRKDAKEYSANAVALCTFASLREVFL